MPLESKPQLTATREETIAHLREVASRRLTEAPFRPGDLVEVVERGALWDQAAAHDVGIVMAADGGDPNVTVMTMTQTGFEAVFPIAARQLRKAE